MAVDLPSACPEAGVPDPKYQLRLVLKTMELRVIDPPDVHEYSVA